MSKKTKKIIFISLIYVIVLALSVTGGFALRHFVQNPFSEAEGGEVELSEIEETNGNLKLNLLVIGADKSGFLSDVIMVVRYDEEHNRLMAMSIPRDTYVVYGKTKMMINSVYGAGKRNGNEAGGISALAKTVSALTGLDINYYVQFDVGTFAKVVDELGGVEFDVPVNMNYEDPVQDLYIHISKGKQILNGQDAENMVRFRGYPQADLKRVEVQQDLLKALIEQKLNIGYVTKLPSIYANIKNDVKSNMSLTDMLKYGKSMLKLDSETGIYTCTMPTKSAGDAHLYQDKEETDKILREEFFTEGIL